ncbi:MAG TPA: hypothetical protein VF188_12855 [Longimicrobiales bacterium]
MTRVTEALRLLVLLAGALWSGACGAFADGAGEPAQSVFTDPRAEQWALGEAPRLQIGGTDERDGYALGHVVGAVLLRDRLIIADRTFSEVRSYSLSGELLSRSGRKGHGPGEFRALSSLASYDDSTVVAWDVALRRLTLLTPNGEVRATFSANLAGALSLSPDFVGVLDGGRFVFRDERPDISLKGEPAGERRDSIEYLILEPDGSWDGLMLKEPGEEVFFYRDGNGTWGTAPVIFGRATLEAIAGASLVIGTNDTLRLERVSGDGSIRHTATLPWVPTPVTSECVELERQRLLEEEFDRNRLLLAHLSPSGDARLSAWLREQNRLLPSRRTLPAFSALRADALGNIWVAEYAAPGSKARTWAVLDSLFSPVARIEVPSHIEILDLDASDLVGLTEDELGRETVALYPIIR